MLGNTLASYLAMKANMKSGARTEVTLLQFQAELAAWPTPTKRDDSSSARHGYTITGHPGTTLLDAARASTGAIASGLFATTLEVPDGARLSPALSRWLMGFPPVWSSYADSATPSLFQ
jgi:hypothetical protein